MSGNKHDDDLGAMLDGLLDNSAVPSGRERKNSFDDSYSLEDSYSSSFGGQSPAATGADILGHGHPRARSPGLHSPSSPSLVAVPAPAPTPSPSHMNMMGSSTRGVGGGGRLEDSAEDGGGFVPSFYDPSKSSRSRRGMSSSAVSGGGSGGGASRRVPLVNDELDALGQALAGSSLSGRKKVVDPFSAPASGQRSSRVETSPRGRGVMSSAKMNLAASLDSDDSLDDIVVPVRVNSAGTGATSTRTPVTVKMSKHVTIAAQEEDHCDLPSVFQRSTAAADKASCSKAGESAKKVRSAMKVDTTFGKESTVSKTGHSNGSPTTLPRHGGNIGSPAWLPSSSSVAAVDTMEVQKDAQIHVLQQKLDQGQLEREAVERQLRLEVDGLKGKLTATISSLGASDMDAAAVSGVAGSSQMSEYSTKLLKENSDLKRTVAQLSSEVSKLKDESIVATNRNREEVKFLKDTATAGMNEFKRRHNDDLRAVDRRQNDAVEALKKMHTSEIEGIKKRSTESNALTQLATQISSTSGSIKLIEEELRSRYQAMELTKEGQFEARERLLSEMETKARERAENAESEQYRIKGIMTHMEQVIANLRSDSIQEKERMRQEHTRLQAMQESLVAERTALQKRVDDELNMLQSRASMVETDSRRASEDKRVMGNNIVEQKRKLEAERAEFAAYIGSSSRNAENTVAELRAEEERINSLRTEIGRERASFEHRKNEAEQELRAAEERRYALESAKDTVNRERMELQRTARDMAASTTHLEQRSQEIQNLENDVRARELALNGGWKEMQRAGAALSKRERELNGNMKQLQVQHVALGQLDNELVARQVEIASSTRAALRTKKEVAKDQERRDYGDALVAATAASSSSGVFGASIMTPGRSFDASRRNPKAVTAELNLARKALSHARHSLGVATNSKSMTQSFLDDETLFLARMNSAKSNSSRT